MSPAWSRSSTIASLLVTAVALVASSMLLRVGPGSLPEFGECAASADDVVGNPWLTEPGPLAISHQGRVEPDDEISASNFRRVVEMGFRFIETDVRLAAPDTAAPADAAGYGLVASHDLLALAPTGPSVATLLAMGDDLAWNFELKTQGTDLDLTAAVLACEIDAADAWDRVCISFGLARTVDEAMARLGPDTCRCATLAERSGLDPLGDDVDCVQVLHQPTSSIGPRDALASERLVDRVGDLGLQVYQLDARAGYTPDEYRELLTDPALRGVISDDPVGLRCALVRLDRWPDSTTAAEAVTDDPTCSPEG